jgi:hypothetical protein
MTHAAGGAEAGALACGAGRPAIQMRQQGSTLLAREQEYAYGVLTTTILQESKRTAEHCRAYSGCLRTRLCMSGVKQVHS